MAGRVRQWPRRNSQTQRSPPDGGNFDRDGNGADFGRRETAMIYVLYVCFGLSIFTLMFSGLMFVNALKYKPNAQGIAWAALFTFAVGITAAIAWMLL